MVRRLVTIIAAFLLALAFPAAAPAQALPQRIVAVGDLHGDYDAWVAIARDAGLVDSSNRWAAGKTIFVQTGDIVDRGPDSLKIIRHLQQLQREAQRAGGRVVVLLGNHEAMNATGDLRYVSPGEYAAFADSGSRDRRERAFELNRDKIREFYLRREAGLSDEQIHDRWIENTPLGKVEHDTAWSPSGDLGRWAASLPAVVKIGDTLFTHGGISANYALVPIAEINRRADAAVKAGVYDENTILYDEMGPLWYRGLVTGTGAGGRPTAANELDVTLKANGAKRLVIGHTPSLKGVVIAFDGKLVRIDTGISRYYGGPLGWIEILGDRVTPHTATRGEGQ